MVYELTFPHSSGTQTAFFLGDGFHAPKPPTRTLHRHTYTEIHAISGGEAQFLIGTEACSFRDGDLFAIPSGVFHMCVSSAPEVVHTAFQTDARLPELARQRISPVLLRAFLEEIRTAPGQTDASRIRAFLSLLSCVLCPESPPPLLESRDHAFIIHEFFSHHYREEVTLADLARQLHFSEKHTARLVLKHTGQTFTQALTAQRITIARHLAATTDMSLGEIACYVGYRSYSGFWKAYRKSAHSQ